MLKQDNLRIPLLSVILLVLVCFSWGGNMVSIKVTTRCIPPLLTATLRSLGALALLWSYALWRGERMMPRRGDLRHGIVIGLLFGGFFFFLYWGSAFTDASRATIFVNSNPLWVAVGAHFLLVHDRLSRAKSIGLACSFLGLILVFEARSPTLAPLHWVGDLMELLSGLFWAACAIYIKRYPAGRSQLQTLFAQLLFSLPILALGWLVFEHRGPDMLTLSIVGNLLYQVVIVGFLSYLVWLRLIHLHPVSKVSAFIFLSPLFGVLLSGLVLREELPVLLWIGLALAAAGLYLVNRSSGARPASVVTASSEAR
jgi:drug/metabolite transporter (DMT)-like permease